MPARPVRAFHVAFEVFAQHRRVVGLGLERIDDDGKLLVLDLDQFHRVGGDIAVLGDDEGHFLPLEEHLAVGEDHLLVAGESRHPMQIERTKVIGGQNSDDPGNRHRLFGVDRLDAGMCIGRADEIAEQHAGKLKIVDIVALALGEPRILDALALRTEALEGGGAFGFRGSHLVHCAASLAAFSSAAAARIALTIFW
jgi:hypothetical protein